MVVGCRACLTSACVGHWHMVMAHYMILDEIAVAAIRVGPSHPPVKG